MAEKKNITTTASLGLVPPARQMKEEETEKAVTPVKENGKVVKESATYKGEPLVQCRPKQSGRIYVGDRYWEFKGGEINTLPKTVKDILHSHGALDAI